MADPEPSPLSDWELWACAQEVIRQHGAKAPHFATLRAESLNRDGDCKGASTWRLILHRIEQLQARPANRSN